MIFLAGDWAFIGDKADPAFCRLLSDVTIVDERVLNGSLSPLEISVASRMKWAASRETTRVEDRAYSLLGLFNVAFPLIYGEGHRSFRRLQEEILKETDDQSLFAWSAPASRIQDPEELRGLLASSPADFANVGIVRPLPPLQTQDSVPSSITNQGLRVHVYLRPNLHTDRSSMVTEEEYLAVLDCSVRERGVDRFPAIFLRRLWGDQYARVVCYPRSTVPRPCWPQGSKVLPFFLASSPVLTRLSQSGRKNASSTGTPRRSRPHPRKVIRPYM